MKDIKTEIAGTTFKLTVDAILKKNGRIVLVKRKYPPEKGKWALPGGIIEINEKLEEAVKREVKEETGYKSQINRMIGIFDDPDRDPGGRSVSTCFECQATEKASDDTEEVLEIKEFHPEKLPELAFDHEKMIKTWKNSENTDSAKK